MGFFNKFVNQIRGNEDEDEYLDDEYFDEEEQEEEEEPLRHRRQAAQKTQSVSGGFFPRKVIETQQGMRVVTIKPQKMEDSRTICDYLLDGTAVVLNMEGISTDIAQRIIDFTLGAIYSIEGDLQQISKFIFIASPNNVELSGEFQGDFAGTNSQAGLAKQQAQTSGGFTFNV